MRRPSTLRGGVAVMLALGLAGCAGTQSALDPAGDQAGRLFSLWTLMLWVCGAVYLLVLLLLGWTLWRHRRALELAGPDLAPDDRPLRMGLVAWATLTTLGLAALAGASFLTDRALARQRGEVLQVRATGQQWWWRLQYREPGTGRWIETANELHLPVNRPARIEIASADVIHSFWVPNLSGKVDMVPGRRNVLLVTPRRPGTFRGQCAEFCGLQHAQMALEVKVESPEAFAAWLARQADPATAPSDAEAAQGLAVFTGGTCAGCHSIRGTSATGRAGPDLTHIATRRKIAAGVLPFTRGALAGWIAQPQAIKPGAEMPPSGLAPADTLAVARYLEGLN
jgi:cytochrome c oxidase subunit 2